MADPCAGHFCDRCEKCRSGVCCQRDRIFWKPKRKTTQPAQRHGQDLMILTHISATSWQNETSTHNGPGDAYDVPGPGRHPMEVPTCTTEPSTDGFWDQVNQPAEGCCEWMGSRTPDGYGLLRIGSERKYAHRTAWELGHGPIPPGMLVCHRCDNPPCCRLDHLFLGTHRDNALDRQAKGRGAWMPKTVCSEGHALIGENRYERPDGRGAGCKECRREATRAWRRRNPGRS